MQYKGILLHHSACPSINGKGFDFFIAKDGAIIPSPEQTDAQYIHICLEGDFSTAPDLHSSELIEQLFILNKLISRLSSALGIHKDALIAHDSNCPGRCFPWPKLVISLQDGYH
jgi:hypothetical protein